MDIFGTITEFVDSLLEGFQAVLAWFLTWAKELACQLLTPLCELIPDAAVQTTAEFSVWLGIANQWFPVTEATAMLGAFYTFQLAFILFKYVWKAIPATG